jgi:glycosyltransferase involved in cell wall biosynthesis
MGEDLKKKIVISAVNLTEGGPLTVLKECLRYLSVNLSDEYEIISLVNRKELAPFENIKYFEFPKSKKLWFNRLYYEYYYFNKLSKRLNPFLWLSLHDITPNIAAARSAVYCHNPAPFYRTSFRTFQLEPNFFLFNLFYKYLYSINLHRNTYIIVQQDWIRKEFINWFGVKNVVVAHPVSKVAFETTCQAKADLYTFIYPAFPRIFKNFEIICLAAEQLYLKGISDFKIIITINGSESRYSHLIYNKFKHIPVLSFTGLQSRNKIFEYYSISDCLIFPSKLETWGLPITEFKKYGKAILLANLPYAHETVGNYKKVKFFSPDNVGELACAMEALMRGDLVFDAINAGNIEPPYAENWEQLFDILLSEQPPTASMTNH